MSWHPRRLIFAGLLETLTPKPLRLNRFGLHNRKSLQTTAENAKSSQAKHPKGSDFRVSFKASVGRVLVQSLGFTRF